MKIVVQRVSEASVWIDEENEASIGSGLLLFLGIHKNDNQEAIAWLCNKILNFRIFEDKDGKMNRSITDVGGALLVISQFTLYGDYEHGNRPGFNEAAGADKAEKLYNKFVKYLDQKSSLPLKTGVFGAYMDVRLRNDGPVTFVLER